jgi:hypothetical protein
MATRRCRMGIFGNVSRAKRGLAIVVRTVWFAGILLLLLLGLLAVKMVSTATAASDDTQDDATSALTQIIPGENTLTEADRSVVAPEADDTALLPVESDAVRSARAEYRPSDIMHRHAPTRAAATKPHAAAGKPIKAADMKSCRQLDPIARFLVSANLAPPCAG